MNKAETPSSEGEDEPLTDTTTSTRTFWFNEEGGEPIYNTKRGSAHRRLHAVFTSSHLYYLVVIFLIFGLYVGRITSQWRFRPLPRPQAAASPHIKPVCGSSPKEALELGCLYDFYADVWLPSACYDRAVVAQSESNSSEIYPAAGGLSPWPLYWDKEMTRRATLKDVMAAAFTNDKHGYKHELNVEFHIAYDFHRAHCLHMWRLAVSASDRLIKGERGVGIYWKVASRDHAWHCTKIIVEGDNRDRSEYDIITPGIGRCVGLDDVWNDVYAGVRDRA